MHQTPPNQDGFLLTLKSSRVHAKSKNTRLPNFLQLYSSCISTEASSVALVALLALLALRLVGSRDDRRWLWDVLAEDVALDEVWEPDSQLVADEFAGGDGEDLCGRCSC